MQSSHVTFPNTSVPPPAVTSRQPRPILGARVDLMQPRSACTASGQPRVPNGLRMTTASALSFMAAPDAGGDAGSGGNVVVAVTPVGETSMSNGVTRLGAPVNGGQGSNGTMDRSVLNQVSRSTSSSANQSVVTYTVCTVRSASPTTVSTQTPIVALVATGATGYSSASSVSTPAAVASPTTVPVVMPPATSPADGTSEVCSHVAMTPTTPVQYTYSSPHPAHAQPVWPAAPGGYAPHGMLPSQPIWTHSSNGMISPSANLAPFHYSLQHPPNGMTAEMFPAPLVHNMMNTNLPQQHLMHAYPQYNTYPGKGKGKVITCHNCGCPGHRAAHCTEDSIDQYQRECISEPELRSLTSYRFANQCNMSAFLLSEPFRLQTKPRDDAAHSS